MQHVERVKIPRPTLLRKTEDGWKGHSGGHTE